MNDFNQTPLNKPLSSEKSAIAEYFAERFPLVEDDGAFKVLYDGILLGNTDSHISDEYSRSEETANHDLELFSKMIGIPVSSGAYTALLNIIYEYQKVSFKAGFRTAVELLTSK